MIEPARAGAFGTAMLTLAGSGPLRPLALLGTPITFGRIQLPFSG
jgi:hypothetical protein